MPWIFLTLTIERSLRPATIHPVFLLSFALGPSTILTPVLYMFFFFLQPGSFLQSVHSSLFLPAMPALLAAPPLTAIHSRCNHNMISVLIVLYSWEEGVFFFSTFVLIFPFFFRILSLPPFPTHWVKLFFQTFVRPSPLWSVYTHPPLMGCGLFFLLPLFNNHLFYILIASGVPCWCVPLSSYVGKASLLVGILLWRWSFFAECSSSCCPSWRDLSFSTLRWLFPRI